MTINDTHPAAQRVLIDLMRDVPVWRRLEMIAELNKTAEFLALQGLRDLHPEATPTELRRHLADLLLGPELAEKVYGPHHSTPPENS